jgi:hypothetical protein
MKMRMIKAVLIGAAAVAAAVASAVFVIPLARSRGQNVSLGREWTSLLKQHPAFSAKQPGYAVDLSFRYAASTDPDLQNLRGKYDLETIAGQGRETDRIINLMSWVYQLTGHANEPEIPKELNAISLIRLATVEHKLINCYMKTVILNEVYLAMGFESRQTHLLPHSHEEEESHFVTSVFSRTLDKWILMDPDFGVYVTDEMGNILGVAEIRSRLVAGNSLVVKDVDRQRSRLARAWDDAQNFIAGVDYPWFLSEFVFKMRCPQNSLFDQASKPDKVYFELVPDGYRPELLQAPGTNAKGANIVYVNNESLFWQKPRGQ